MYFTDIQKHIACPKLQSFYTSTGEVDVDALQKLLGDGKPESVIGWYKQRRNSEQQMTLREKTVHQNLKNTLSNPHMIFLLLTPSYFTASGSTHKTEYAAYILRCSQVTNVPVLVNNLGLLEPVSYCKDPALCSAEGYNLTVNKHRSKFFSSDGRLNEVEDIKGMNESLQSELYNLCRVVEDSERQLETLQKDIQALRRKINQNKLQTDPCDPLPEPKRNMLLHEAVRALFGSSPLLQSQTLTTAAFPILDFCCSVRGDEDEDAAGDTDSELLQRNRAPRKRPTDITLGNDHKRKKT